MTVEERAAGAVLWRSGDGGAPLVAVVHRPRYDDWSLPKGKLDPGETDLAAARREVLEETGFAAEVGPELGTVRYRHDRRGKARDKRVRYWAMRAGEGQFEPSDEVDELRWLDQEQAARLLTYDRDREVLDWFGGVSLEGG